MAQSYPTRPVHIIVGFAAGGPNDISARLMGQWLSERLGQQFVIENRPGAAGNVATELVVNAAADGYTLLLVPAPAAINATLYDNLNFNFIRDIAPVAGILRVPEVMVVNPSVPANTVPEFITYAKANPGKINIASAGNGSVPHVAGELFKVMTGVNLVRVGYRGGGPALIDLISGQVWFGIGAPKKTPTAITEKLSREINASLADSKLQERIADLGGVPMPMSPAEFAKFIVEETDKSPYPIAA